MTAQKPVELIVVPARETRTEQQLSQLLSVRNANDVLDASERGQQLANFFNVHLADSPSMHITAKEGEALWRMVDATMRHAAADVLAPLSPDPQRYFDAGLTLRDALDVAAAGNADEVLTALGALRTNAPVTM